MADSLPAIVVGAGISGLTCAYALKQAGIEVCVFEAGERPGGLIRSLQKEGFLLELGPQSFSGTAALRQLSQELGIEGQVQEAPPRAPRFVLLDGALKAVPLSPPAFFASSFVGVGTKWALLRDIFGSSKPPAHEESIAAFTRRKFSAELLDKLVGPFVSGIYAGDSEKLSLRAAFPQLFEAEAAAGSVVRGAIRAAKQSRQQGQPRQRRTVESFRAGNETLVHALAENLGDSLHLRAAVTAIVPSPDAATFAVDALVDGKEQRFATRNVILALPTNAAALLLKSIAADLACLLEEIEYAPVAVVSLGYRLADVGRDLDGFGFLVPRSAGCQTLGSVWNSSLFPGRAPEGHALLTSFVGGATNPAALQQTATELADLVHRELAPILKLSQSPAFSHVTSYGRAIPQYNLGHPARVEALETLPKRVPGLFLTGNYLHGPAVGACVEQAQAVAKHVAARLNP
jgi:protoporphyrinogen/coproporphyrinogen III oxidase